MSDAAGSGQSKTAPTFLSRLTPWFGAAVVALCFVLGAAMTWRKWPDILIDFGLQLYLPWKISTGSVLYHDVKYLTAGPLSQYYHALLFKICGTSFSTIIYSNLLLTAGLLILLLRQFKVAADALTATMVCLGITLVFAFNQYGDIGNYNYIAPYCHEVVHGVFLSMVALVFLANWLRRECIGMAAAAGFCLGLVFLTKPEVFAAISLATLGAFALLIATRGRARIGFAAKSLAALLLAGAIPFVAFLLYFRRSESWREAVRSAGFAWVPLLHGGVTGGHFYKWCMGLDTPTLHLMGMLKQFMVVVIVLAVFAFLFRRKMDSTTNRLMAIAGVAAALAGASAFNWNDCGRALQLLDAACCVLLCANYRNFEREKPVEFMLLWTIFAFFLTAKLGLFCRIWHYGFILAMPAFVGTLILVLWLLPRLLTERYAVNARLFRLAVSLLLLTGFASLFLQSQRIYRDKTIALGQGGDEMFAFTPKIKPDGAAFQSALPWLEKNAPPGATLAVLPEGIIVNYLSRRSNPTQYLVWNPVELAMFGQDSMTDAFERSPPDYVMLIHREGAEYGVKHFGQEMEFGGAVLQWIRQNYQEVYLVGDEPLRTSAFGISILKRRISAH